MHVVHWIVPLFSLFSCNRLLFPLESSCCFFVHILMYFFYMKLFPLLRQPRPSDILPSCFSYSVLSGSGIHRPHYTFSSYNGTDPFQFLIMSVLDISRLFGVLPRRFVVLCPCFSNQIAETKFTSSVARTSFA